MIVRCLFLSAVLTLVPCADGVLAAEGMVVRVYSVAEIVRTVPDYPYQPGLPTTDPAPLSIGTGTGTLTGGGGFGGGGAGGGFFQIGGGVAGLSGVRTTTVHEDVDMNALIDVIQQSIAPTSWSNVGGEGTILALGTSLVIRQTEEAHREIGELLKELAQMADHQTMLTIQTFLLTAASGEEAESWTARIAGAQDDNAKRGSLMAELRRAADETGRINCFSGQQVHLASGQRRSIVKSAIPVVSAYVVGYQPVVDYPHIGTILELSAGIDAAGQSVLLDINCRVTEWNDAGDPVRVSSVFGPGKVPSSEPPQAFGGQGQTQVEGVGGRSEVAIDRINMGTRELATTVRVPVSAPGEPLIPFIVGTLGQAGPSAGDPDARRVLTFLIVTVSRAEATPSR